MDDSQRRLQVITVEKGVNNQNEDYFEKHGRVSQTSRNLANETPKDHVKFNEKMPNTGAQLLVTPNR